MLISGILIIWLIAALIQTVHNRQNGVYIYKHREYEKIDGKLMIVKVRDEKVNFGLAFVAYLINDFKQLFALVFPSILEGFFRIS